MQNITNLLLSLMLELRQVTFYFVLTLFECSPAHDFNRRFHDDHPINVVLLFMRSAEIFPAPHKISIAARAQKGKNLNPLSSEFDTIITKDFHSLAEATSACRIRLHKCDVMERWTRH